MLIEFSLFYLVFVSKMSLFSTRLPNLAIRFSFQIQCIVSSWALPSFTGFFYRAGKGPLDSMIRRHEPKIFCWCLAGTGLDYWVVPSFFFTTSLCFVESHLVSKVGPFVFYSLADRSSLKSWGGVAFRLIGGHSHVHFGQLLETVFVPFCAPFRTDEVWNRVFTQFP